MTFSAQLKLCAPLCASETTPSDVPTLRRSTQAATVYLPVTTSQVISL